MKKPNPEDPTYSTYLRKLETSRAWKARNIEKKRAEGRRWHKENYERSKSNHEKWKLRNRNYMKLKKAAYRSDEVNREIERKSGIAWRQKNAENLRKKYKEYRESHKLERALSQRGRDAVKVNSGGRISADQICHLWNLQKGKCVFFSSCGNLLVADGPRKWHVDHIDPLRPKDKTRISGMHIIDNVQLLCAACNMKKSASDPYRFAQKNGLLFCDIMTIPK